MGRFSIARRARGREVLDGLVGKALGMNPKAVLLIGATTMTLAAFGTVTVSLADGYPAAVAPPPSLGPSPWPGPG